MHRAQKYFMETAEGVKDFIAMVIQKLEGRNHDDILNMDQTPISIPYHLNKTLEVKGTKTIHARASTANVKQVIQHGSDALNKILEVKGTKTIHARASTANVKQVILATTVTSSGKMLPPFPIFKGKPNGGIAMQEFLTFHACAKYACQEKA